MVQNAWSVATKLGRISDVAYAQSNTSQFSRTWPSGLATHGRASMDVEEQSVKLDSTEAVSPFVS